MKSSFKVKETQWLDTKGKVKHLKDRNLTGYIAYNESPPMIDIIMGTGPNDLGIQRDVVIDVKSLVKALKECGLIAA